MAGDRSCQVLIIGGGPTGLMAANQLARFSIDLIILDKKDGPTHQSRAIAVTARSLEIYQQMGLSEQVIKDGAKINSFQLYSGGRPKATVRIGEIGKGLTEFSYLLGFEQSKNEELLYRNLQRLGHEVLWETEFLRSEESQGGVEAQVRQGGRVFKIKAKYLIACDGASSPVRQELDFTFKGGTYENKFFVADTVIRWELNYDQVVLSPGKKNFCAFLPMKGSGCYRVIGTLPKEYFQNDNVIFSDIKEIVIHTLGVDVKFDQVNWFSIYKLHHRCADHFRKGSVFLAGDSAHIHSPAGGQGMNTGLQDAYNLAWKLAFVLKKQGKDELLDTYSEERLPFARWLLKFTDRGFNLMTSDRWILKSIRKYILLNIAGYALAPSWIRPFVFKTISQIGYSYRSRSLSRSFTNQPLRFKAGDRLPYLEGSGTGLKLYELLREPSFHLLHVGENRLESQGPMPINGHFAFPIKVLEVNSGINAGTLFFKNTIHHFCG